MTGQLHRWCPGNLVASIAGALTCFATFLWTFEVSRVQPCGTCPSDGVLNHTWQLRVRGHVHCYLTCLWDFLGDSLHVLVETAKAQGQENTLLHIYDVQISVTPKEVKFLTRGGEFGRLQISCKHDANLANPEATIINVEQSVLLSLCFRCLHKYVKAITEEIPKAGQVTMNMSSDPKLPCVIEHTITGTGSTGLYSAHFKCPKEGRKASEGTSDGGNQIARAPAM